MGTFWEHGGRPKPRVRLTIRRATGPRGFFGYASVAISRPEREWRSDPLEVPRVLRQLPGPQELPQAGLPTL